MLLTDARRAARTGPAGELIPLAEQDRSPVGPRRHRRGRRRSSPHALRSARLGPYQVQAAIAAVHDEAPTADDTDWLQILALYDVLDRLAPNPMVTLNQAVARAMVLGPEAGLELLATLDDDERMADHHRLHAVRAHLREMAGDTEAARAGYLDGRPADRERPRAALPRGPGVRPAGLTAGPGPPRWSAEWSRGSVRRGGYAGPLLAPAARASRGPVTRHRQAEPGRARGGAPRR